MPEISVECWHQIDATLLLPFHPSMLQNHTARSYQEGSNNLTQGFMNLLKLEHKMTLKTKQNKCKGDSCGEQQLLFNNDLKSLKLDMNQLRLFIFLSNKVFKIRSSKFQLIILLYY